MKYLHQFPFIFRSFHTIEVDSRGVHARPLKPLNVVPEDWVDAFEVAESVLQKVEGKDVSHIPELSGWGEFEHDTPLWEVLTLPVDDSNKEAMTRMEIPKADQWIFNQVMYHFFDGELGNVFT